MVSILRKSRCRLESASRRAGGVASWTLIAPSDSAVDRLVGELRDAGAAVMTERMVVLRTVRELTVDQEKVLRSALDLGYFDYPRRLGLEELADRLGMKRSCLEAVLQRAQSKVIRSRCGE